MSGMTDLVTGDGHAPASRTHAATNTVLALLAALTAIASAVAHHYTVVVRPEVCPAVSTAPTDVTQKPGRSIGPSVRAVTPQP